MTFESILIYLDKTPDQAPASRRETIAKGLGIVRKVAAAALPLGLGSIAFPANASSTVEALNLMLELKRAQLELYNKGIVAATAPATFANSETPSVSIDNTNILRALTEL